MTDGFLQRPSNPPSSLNKPVLVRLLCWPHYVWEHPDRGQARAPTSLFRMNGSSFATAGEKPKSRHFTASVTTLLPPVQLFPRACDLRCSVLSANASGKNTPYLVHIFYLALDVIASWFSKTEKDNRWEDGNIPEMQLSLLLSWSKVVNGSSAPALAPTDLSFRLCVTNFLHKPPTLTVCVHVLQRQVRSSSGRVSKESLLAQGMKTQILKGRSVFCCREVMCPTFTVLLKTHIWRSL